MTDNKHDTLSLALIAIATAIAIVIALIAIATTCRAANVVEDESETRWSHIIVEGPIEPGDSDKLDRLLRRAHDAGVHILVDLVSSGGPLKEGFYMAASIRGAGAFTSVPAGYECASSCAFVWAAGRKRYAEGRVTFHRPYYIINGRPVPVPLEDLQNIRATWIQDLHMSASSFDAAMNYAPTEGLIIAGPGAQ